MCRRFLSFFLCSLTLHLVAEDEVFPNSIPVVDMRLFDKKETRLEFIEQFASALHEIGFCALINTEFNDKALEVAYRSVQTFFKSSQDKKKEISFPNLSGQRGFVLSEIAQGEKNKDVKEFLHFGLNRNYWPTWMNLQEPIEELIFNLNQYAEKIEQAISIFLGQNEQFLSSKTKHGDSLLRALYYPLNDNKQQFWAAEHTDIDLFTILPMSTEAGLQVLYKEQWIDVKVPKGAFIINCGDMLENLSNGYFKSSVHRVISQKGKERFSIVYFVHPGKDEDISPLHEAVNISGGVKKFPDTTQKEMLAHRLVELGIASQEIIEYDANSGYIEKIQQLIEDGTAAVAVQKTYKNWSEKK